MGERNPQIKSRCQGWRGGRGQVVISGSAATIQIPSTQEFGWLATSWTKPSYWGFPRFVGNFEYKEPQDRCSHQSVPSEDYHTKAGFWEHFHLAAESGTTSDTSERLRAFHSAWRSESCNWWDAGYSRESQNREISGLIGSWHGTFTVVERNYSSNFSQCLLFPMVAAACAYVWDLTNDIW